MKLLDEYGNELSLVGVLGMSDYDGAIYDEGKIESLERRVESISQVMVNLLSLLTTKGINLSPEDINFLSSGTSGYKTVEDVVYAK